MKAPLGRELRFQFVAVSLCAALGTASRGAQLGPIACPDPRFDANLDAAVELDDFRTFQACFAGPADVMPINPPRCRCFDFDGNDRVDLADFAAFELCFSGSIAAGRACDGPPVGNLRPGERLHLSVIGLATTPQYPVPGELVDVAVTIRNESETLDANAVVLALNEETKDIDALRADLAANQTLTVHLSWEAGSPGVHTLVAAIDPAGEFIDHNRLDNVLTAEILVALAPPKGGELAVTVALLQTPDQSLAPQATIINNGDLPALAPFAFEGFEAAGSMLVSQSDLLGPIRPGESVLVNISWPADVPIERYLARVEPRFFANEINPLNNIVVRNPLPTDLYVETVSVYQLKNDGETVPMVSFRVVNGGANSVGTFRTEIRNVQEARAFEVVTTGLAAGQKVFISFLLPTDIIKGGEPEFDIRITADSTNSIAETNEGNNASSVHFQWALPQIDRWVSIGPRVMIPDNGGATGVLDVIAVARSSPAPDAQLIMYVAAAAYAAEPSQSGIWLSENSGETWRPVGDSLPSTRIMALAIPPMAPMQVYAVASSGEVFKSEDTGTSWKQISDQALEPRVQDGGGFFVHPTDPLRLYLTCRDGVRRSLDAGVTWQRVLGTGSDTFASGLVMNLSNPDHLIAAVTGAGVVTSASCFLNPPAIGLYESFDGGTTWCRAVRCPGSDAFPDLADVSRIGLAISGSHLFASFKTSNDWSVYYTTELSCFIGPSSGRTWRRGYTLSGDAAGPRWSGLYADPGDPNFVYAHGTHMLISDDGGRTFHNPSTPAHADHHGFATDPRDHRVVYTLGDGGIYKSTDNGDHWAQIGHGITNAELYDIADAPSNPAILIAGTQDNGNVKYDGISPNWTAVGVCESGDGDIIEIDPTNDRTVYIMGQYSDQLCKSTNGGPFVAFDQGLPGGCPHLRYLIHPRIPTTLLYPCGLLYRTTTNTPPANWIPLAVPIAADDFIQTAAVDGGADLYYAGTARGALYAGVNGVNWQLVFTHPSAMGTTDIEFDPDDPRTVYASFGGGFTRRVYRLRRPAAIPAGPWTMTAADITANLPQNESVRALGVDRNHLLTIYAGTHKSVHRGRSLDGGVTWAWTPYRYGLPSAVDVRDLEVHPTTGVIRAGTVGRGAFEVFTGPPVGSLLAAEGRVTSIRVHEVGTGYGPPGDVIDGEVVILLDTWPGRAFGFTLRENADKNAHRGMLNTLRTALRNDSRVRVDYIRTGVHNGRIIRVLDIR